MKYNKYFADHFSGCRVLVRGRDEHRNRDVEVVQIPGEVEFVGIRDGVDAWVAPVNTAPSELFDKVRRVMADLRANPDTAVAAEAPASGSIRRRPLTLPTSSPAVVGESQAETRIRRRVVHS